MRPALVTGSALLLLSLTLSGCGGDDGGGAKAAPEASTSASVSASVSAASASSTPADPATASARLPDDETSDGASSASDASDGTASGAGLVACDLVTADVISTVFGADPGQPTSEPSGLGDPDAQDCFWFGGEATIVVQATTRADQDLPESGYSYAGLDGAEEIPGADRGEVYLFPGQSGDTVTSGIILVKGQTGLQISVTVQGHPYDTTTLQTFAQDLLEAI